MQVQPMAPDEPRKPRYGRFLGNRGFVSPAVAFTNAFPGMVSHCLIPRFPGVEVCGLLITGQQARHVESVAVRVNGYEIAYAGPWSDDDGTVFSGGQWMNAQASFIGLITPPDGVFILFGSGSVLCSDAMQFAEVRIQLPKGAPHGASLTIYGNGNPRDIEFL